MKERRRFMRFKTSLKGVYKCLDGLPAIVKSTVLDISRGGLRLSDVTPLQKGLIVELMISVPGEGSPIVAFAQEVWSSRVGETQYDKGLRFTKIASADRAKLIDYAYHKLTNS
ncbi:PilZ domain-containing protein [Candidatus Omnitrophota bacterium]